MKTISKKDVRHSVEEAMNKKLTELNIADPSKKTKRLVKKASRKISARVKVEFRKQTKKTGKKPKSEKPSDRNGKKHKNAAVKAPVANG